MKRTQTSSRPGSSEGRSHDVRKHYKKPNLETKAITEAIVQGLQRTLTPLFEMREKIITRQDSVASLENAQNMNGLADNTANKNKQQNITGNAMTCIEKPKQPIFRDKGDNPVKFIQQLKSYIRKIHSQEDEIEIAMECLSSSVKAVMNIFRHKWACFGDFEKEFLNIYWNLVIQDKVREEIMNGEWVKQTEDTKLTYFSRKLELARELTNAIPEPHLINIIMRQFPEIVQTQWIAVENPTLEKAALLLKGLDGYVIGDNERKQVTSDNNKRNRTDYKDVYNSNRMQQKYKEKRELRNGRSNEIKRTAQGRTHHVSVSTENEQRATRERISEN